VPPVAGGAPALPDKDGTWIVDDDDDDDVPLSATLPAPGRPRRKGAAASRDGPAGSGVGCPSNS
jgi:hypothetical protein